MLPPCPECGLRPRYLVNGKWATFTDVLLGRDPVSVRPQHHRWCASIDNWMRQQKRLNKSPRARG